jgi:response regulator receiver domain-containing protein
MRSARWPLGLTVLSRQIERLDVMLAGLGDVEVCRRLRLAGRWAPVLMLTARDRVADRISGLDVGADDYLVKPFAFGELLARPRAQVWGTAGHSGCGARPGSRLRWAVCRRPARLPNASAPLGQTPLGSLADVEGVTNSGLRLLLHCGVRWQTHRVTKLRGQTSGLVGP